MDDDMKHLRVRFAGSGVRQEDHGGGNTVPVPSSQRRTWLMSSSSAEEYDAAYAATVAAVAYAIAAREQERRLAASQERPVADSKFASERKPVAEKLASRNKPAAASIDEPRTTPPPAPKRGESLKRPLEGSRSSRWFTGKEPVGDDYEDEQANVSVTRPLRPAQKKPGGAISDEKVSVTDSAPSMKKDPSFTRIKAPEKKGSRRFEQDQGNHQTVPLPPTARPTTMGSYSGSRRESGATATTTTSGSVAFSSEAEAMADAWEKEKLAKIKKQYRETMDTIAEWEAEKKAKARRQKELKDESESDRKRAKALEEYNEEMARIGKVAAASRLTAEEKRRSAERKVRDKAHTIRVTGKLPGPCGCF